MSNLSIEGIHGISSIDILIATEEDAIEDANSLFLIFLEMRIEGDFLHLWSDPNLGSGTSRLPGQIVLILVSIPAE